MRFPFESERYENVVLMSSKQFLSRMNEAVSLDLWVEKTIMQMDKKINGQRGSRQTNKQRVMQTEKYAYRQTDKQTNWQLCNWTNGQTEKTDK